MAKTIKRIVVPRGAIKKIAEQQGCSDKYVSQCLRGLYETPKAEAVRQAAKKYK